MSLSLELSQKQALTTKSLQMLSVLQMSTQEIENYIDNAALENPVIDLVDTKVSNTTNYNNEEILRKLDWLSQTDHQNRVYYQQDIDDNSREDWYGAGSIEETLADYLNSQLLLQSYTKLERAISDYLINSLDSSGYLMEDTQSIASFFSIPERTILKLLNDIQKLEPAGVGARDLKECLFLQLKRLDINDELVYKIVYDHLNDLAKNHLDIIARKLNTSSAKVLKACEIIRSLNPKPGNSFSSREHLKYIRPDVFIIKTEDTFEILINEYGFPSISINVDYTNLLSETTDKETQIYLKEKIIEAENIIYNIKQRHSTLSTVANALVTWQKEFFVYGPGHLRPMKLSDLAKIVGVHESTISRALSNKYLQCFWGIFPMNYFLIASINKSKKKTNQIEPSLGNDFEITQNEVLTAIKEIINNEHKAKPLSDQKISEALSEKGFTLSRRTVTKYRSILGLPDKSGRKTQ